MIKLSKDNLIVWGRLFPIMLFSVHLFFIILVTAWGFWPTIVAYLFVAFLQAIKKPWRLFFIKDLYLTTDTKNIIFKSLSDKETEFKTNQIIKQKTSNGITLIEILQNDKVEKWYCTINSKDNLKFLLPTQI
jgi:hypothetical protein